MMTAHGFLEEKEYICCHEVVKMKDPYFEMDKNECVTKHPKFEKYVLDKGYPHMRLGGLLYTTFSVAICLHVIRQQQETTGMPPTDILLWWPQSKGRKNVRRRLPACALSVLSNKIKIPCS